MVVAVISAVTLLAVSTMSGIVSTANKIAIASKRVRLRLQHELKPKKTFLQTSPAIQERYELEIFW